MLADYHMHTKFSDDSDFEMEDEILCAIEKGLDEICFTEHVDYGVKFESNCDYTQYFSEFERCKEKYKNQIRLKKGIEFGMQSHTIAQFQRDFDEYDFDFVILSCHQIQNLEFWNGAFQKGKTQKEINEAYYEEIYHCICNYKDYSVLGHLDAIKRDDPYGVYEDDLVMDLIDKILKKVIEDGKGIEVNTSNFRYHLPDLTPSRKILKRYYDLGGRVLTFGSDSHKKEHVGYKIEEVRNIVKEIGFSHFMTFEKMKMIEYEL